MPQALRLLRERFPDRPAFGTAVSEAILTRVAAGELPPTLRLHRPGRELAFSKQDRLAPGFERAVAAASAAGFEPVLRLAGGRAAAFHEGTLALARATPDPHPARNTKARFEEISGVVTAALATLGIDARVGEVPGEYCPGAWSVNARGRLKLVGIGQRLIAGGAHIGVVVVVTDSALLRRALEPVYDALELEWDPATAGAVEDEAPGVTLGGVEEAILAELSRSTPLEPATLDAATLALAERLEAGRLLAGGGLADEPDG
jgi:octanoyl-[GcvH]:protein N-octanoyltransferase